jgi:cell division protein FtsI (penicillin-binding protein 3)
MPSSNFRLRLLILFAVSISIIMIIRVIYLTSVDQSEYNIMDNPEYSIKRGDILDRNGKLLAVSDELESVYLNPDELKNNMEAINLLSNVLNINKNTITNKIDSNKNFIWIKRQISPSQANIIKNAKIKGIYLKKEYKRFYPNKNLASQILGFCNIDNVGIEGIEKGMNSLLYPEINPAQSNEDEIQGYNITLTIDSFVQAFAESALKESVLEEKADSGSVIFADGTTGEVLAMANYPDFNPNDYQKYNQKLYRNNSVFYQFEPGSVFKIFTISSALNENLITTDDYFMCKGYYTKDDFTVKDTGIHGMVNISKIFKYSCNTGTLEAVNKMNEKVLYEYLKKFGFGEYTSMMLPGEQPGLLRDISNWTARSMLAIPIGQEVSVNSIQIVQAATTFFNDGIMIEPLIVKNVFDDKNKILKSYGKKEIRRILKPGISSEIVEAMQSATDEIGGTVRLLKIAGINFSAKSGTAQIYDTRLKKYSDTDVVSSLITFFPEESPKYICYVVYNKPKGKIQWGGIIGAKFMNNFISKITGYIDINFNETAKIKDADISIKNESLHIMKLPFIMPDLTGYSGGEVLDIFSGLNININIEGTGKVRGQFPEPGTKVEENVKLKFFLK